ncbi:MAG: hypothetical protein FWE78_05040 [Methanimicrococcus sp.]|nr:hypothetical protein [Methanimicrococcus sp.]
MSPSSDDDIKTVFYPIYSDRVGVGSSGYYNYDVGFFTSFDEDIFEKMADHELIYRFDNNYLRSVYWFTGFRPETYDYGTVFMPQQMVYSVNLSDSQDVSIGSLFICPEHDPDSDMYGNSGGAEKGSCAEDLKWVLFINGEPREAADYLNIITNNAEGSDPASPGTPGNQGTPGNPGNSGNTGNSGSDVNTGFQHIVTFTDLSLLYDDLMESPNVTFMFYPSSSSRDYEEAAVLFVFELEGVHISMSEKGYLLPNGEFHVPVSSNPEPKNPTLSSMAFPEGMSSLLSAATVLIGDLDRGTLKDFDSENLLEDSDVFVHLFVDINFGKSKDSVNQYLSDMGETVSLVFLVPKQINSVAVAKDELKVFHAVETNGQQVLEELKLTIADDPESAYYIVTAETTSFSPFAVVTVLGSGPVSGDDPSGDNGENPNVPVTAGSSSSGTGRSAVILGRTNGSDSSEQNNSVHPNPPIPSLSTVIESLQGHLSMFSILVVLVSGMFMWNYIRRRV